MSSIASKLDKIPFRRKGRILALAIAILTVLGPYETFTIFERICYWAAVLIPCGIIFHISIEACLSSLRLARSWQRLSRFFMGVTVGTSISLWIVVGVEAVSRNVVALTTIPWMFICVFVIGTAIGFVNFMPPFVQIAEFKQSGDIDFDSIQFYRENSDLKGSKIRWITMEDHYARIVLDRKVVSIHSTMSLLEKQLEHYPGLRVHRSHWVAYESLRTLTHSGRNMEIPVEKGTNLPIGGKYLGSVERIFAELEKSRPKKNGIEK